MSNPNNYTVGWICALSTEYVAAQAFLDEKHDPAKHLAPGNQNDYTLGRMSNHNVVIAVLPIGEYGTSSAARVAESMLHSFPNVRVGLMVGIGGGVPTRHDIRLGDIVVSVPSNGHPGVLRYDFGKTIQGQRFQVTGTLNQPPGLLRAAVNGLKSQYELDGHNLEDAISTSLSKKPRLRKKYQRPGLATDRLYSSHIVHPTMCASDCATSCGDSAPAMITRCDRSEDDDNPMVHYGLIASANQLMKDATARDRLAVEKDVLCFEMEAAGLMNHFPCLVIRGICDYSDSHKSKEWHGYAAMAAAAYTKDLLARISPQVVGVEEKITETLKNIDSNISNISTKVDCILGKQDDLQDQEILAWLTPLDFTSQQNDLISRRQEGTGEWLLTSSAYLEWESTKGRILYCPGIPGAGKTMTSSAVINLLHLKYRDDHSTATLFVYCNFRRHEEQKPVDLILSLLKQLSQRRALLPSLVRDLYDRHSRDKTRPSVKDITKTLQTVLCDYSKIFIVIDALDEYQSADRLSFLSELLNIIEATGANLFATSRFIPDIDGIFSKNNALVQEIQALPEDICKYIDGNMGSLPSFVSKHHDLQDMIKQEIVRAASGMFLLAQLQLGFLVGRRSPKDIKVTLRNLRTGVEAYDDTYTEIMERIGSQHCGLRDLAMEALAWVTLARWPLSATELLHALAVEPGSSALDEENLSDIDHIVSLCAGLLTVNKGSGIVRLVHYTAQEYFQKTSDSWFATGHDMLTRASSTYLRFDEFGMDKFRNDKCSRREIMATYPLLDYAAMNWGHHAALSSLDAEGLIVKFLESDAHVSFCGKIMASRLRPRLAQYRKPKLTGLHLAINLRLTRSISQLLARGYGPDVQDDDGRTPLSWAAEHGHDNIVKLLIDGTASVNLGDERRRTPLHHAARWGCTATLNLLISHGANINVVDKDGDAPLNCAVRAGHEDPCRVLLSRGADVNNLSLSSGISPLAMASREGYESIVRALLDFGADIDHQDWDNKATALWYAVCWGHTGVIKLLLDRGANTALYDKSHITPLAATVSRYHDLQVANLLLDKGAAIDDRGYCGQTPLMMATDEGDYEMAQLLLRRGAIVDLQDEQGQTALSYALEKRRMDLVRLMFDLRPEFALDAWNIDMAFSNSVKLGQIDLVRAFLSRSPNVDFREEEWDISPLCWAAHRGYEEITKLLLDQGAAVNLETMSGKTPLCCAAMAGNITTMRLLLDHGANVNKCAPLLDAVINGHEAAIAWLVDRGANIEIPGHDPPLLEAVFGDHDTVVKQLLDIGCRINSRSRECKDTALIVAAFRGNQTIAKLLLDRKANIDAQNRQGRTALSCASEQGYLEIVPMLLEFNAGIDISDNQQRTPLWWANEKGHTAIVELLERARWS